jgi:hypothetical protein
MRQRHVPSVPPMIRCNGRSGCLLVGVHDARKMGQFPKRWASPIPLHWPPPPHHFSLNTGALGVNGTLHFFPCLDLLIRAQPVHVFSWRSQRRKRGCSRETRTRSPEREQEEGCDAGDDAASVPQMWPPNGEPQPENLGGPCSRCRCRPHCRSCYRGGSGSWWRGRSEEMGARSPKGEREEGGTGGRSRFLAVSPPRTATGQQE